MKKIYSLFLLMVAAMASFGASAQKTVEVYCNDIESVVLRDGGPEGKVLNAAGCTADEPVSVTFTDALFIGLANEDKLLDQVTYTGSNGWSDWPTITNDQVTIAADEMYDGAVSVNIRVADPVLATLTVEDPEVITVKRSEWGGELAVVKGENKLKLGTSGGFYLEVKDPNEYKLISLFRVSDGKQYDIKNFSSCSVYSYEMNSGDAFSYVTVPASEFEAPTFSITVDNPSAVKVSVNYSALEMSTFTPGEPKKIEMTGNSSSVSIQPAVYGDELYKVTLNGDVLTSYNYLSVKENDEIVVTADFPEIYRKINISCEYLDAIKTVTVAGKPIDDWKNGFEAIEGKNLSLSFNNSFYSIEGVEVNGEPVDADQYSYSTKVLGDMNILVKAAKYPTLTATVNVNDPEAVKFTLEFVEYKLKAGANTVEFTEKSNYAVVSVPSNRYKLNSVTVTEKDGEPVDKLTYGSAYITLTDGMVVDIDASALALDQKAVIYSTNASDDPLFGSFGLKTYTGVEIPVEKGYSTFDFNESEAPFSLSVYTEDYDPVEPAHVYVNGEEMKKSYSTYSLPVENNAVVKLYFFVDPATYTAAFDIEDGCNVSVVKDLIVPVADPAEGVSDLQGTLIQLKNEDADAPIEVYVVNVADEPAPLTEGESANAGEKVSADENGVYNITLDASKKITVRKDASAGVVSVEANQSLPADVYNVAGVVVLRNATQEQINSLPAGIYIVAGRKVAVK